MPHSAGSRSRRVCRVCICLCVIAAFAVPQAARAAAIARLNPDEARQETPFATSLAGGDVSLTGFHCSVMNDTGPEAFAADPDYSEMPPTVGLEFVLDAGGSPPLTAAGLDDVSSTDVKSPLSATLSRIIVEGRSSLTDSRGMEEVSLPEASMSVADIMGRCRP